VPIRRLLRQRNKLMQRTSSLKVKMKLEHIERMIYIFRQRAEPKSPRISSGGVKREYRDVDLVFGLH
jgi:hypothetical protein